MRVIVTGATGLAGSEVLRQCLSDPDVSAVTVIARRAPNTEHPKLHVVLHEDFTNVSPLLPVLRGCDACLWCLGTAQSAVAPLEYEKVTYDFAVTFAKALSSQSPLSTFCFLSGGGADSAEQSRFLFARIKGRTENALQEIVPHLYCFRPGYIRPLERRPERPIGERVFGLLAPALRKASRKLVIDADELARAMILVAKTGAPRTILENADILDLAKEPRRAAAT